MALSDTDVDPPPAHMLFAPSGDESARQPLPDGTVMVLDRDLRVVLAAGPGMAGGDATTAGLAGARLETLVPAVGRGVLADHVRSALDASTLALPGRDGEAPHQITIVPRRDATGDVTEVLLVSWEATGSAARTAAAQSERRYRLLTESATETVTLRDPDGTYCYVSPSSAALMGYRPEELVGRNAMELVHPTDAAHVARGIAGLLDGEDVVELEYRLRRRDGSWIWVQTTAIALRDPAGAALGEIRTSTRDITTRRAHEAELWAMTARLKLRLRETAAIAHLGAHALEQPDLDSFLADATRTVAEVFDVPLCAVLDEGDAGTGGPRMRAGVGWRDGVVGRSLPARPLQPGRRPSRLVDAATAVGELLPDRTWAPTLRAHGAVSGVWVLVGEREAPLAVLAVHACTPRVFSADERAFLVAVAKILRDAIVRRRAEDAARHDALHDALTGLPNRTLLTDRLAQALARARRSGSRHAVIFLDVDHFKLVNDSLGHAIGDRLLDAIGRRLRAAVRPADTVARFGGDEFVVLCEDLEYVQHAAHITQRLTDALRVPFDLGGREHVVTASAGLAVTDDTPRTADDVLDDADTAMYRAKAGGRARFELFDSSMRESTLARLELEDELRRAVTRDELVVAYQPIHHVDSDQPALVEALVRWQHPERGLLPPGAFIAIAEDSDLIVDVGAYVLRVACAQVAHWRATLAAARDLGLTINVAARQLARPDFVAEVTAILTATGMPAHALGLEITEGVLLADGGAAISTITALRDLGVRVLLDDFGTGYSSLSYLRRFPLDVLKIDRSFVTSLPESAEDRVVVEAIITMAHALGMDVTAEGVETPEQLQVLRQLGCGYAQGYLLARPMFADKLEELLHAAAA